MIPWDVLRRQRAAIAELIDEASDEVLLMWARAWTDLRAEIEAELARRGEAAMLTYSADYAGQRLIELGERSAGIVSGAARRLVELSMRDAAALIGAQLPSLWPLARPAKPELDAIVQRATTQITSRMWVLSDEATEAMRRRLVQGVAAGRNPRDTARLMVADVQDAFDGGLARAQVISRTETIDAYRTGAKAHHEANSDVLQGWVWLANLSARTCPSCVAMHGTEHDLDEPGPLDHPQGRCSRMPLVKPELVPNAPKPVIESGPEWLARQPEGVQRSVLGPRRFEAWQDGNYPASRWAVRRESEAWRPSYGPGPISG